MKLGVCYYPEHWPEERWALDARLMRDLGLDLVRIGEFAWARMEPAPGQADWAWLDRAIETLTGAGLQLLLGTPTATPPAWLSRAHPDILRVDADGRSRNHGSRRHACLNNPTYRAESRRIVTAMAERYGEHPALVGWQIDNEFGGGGTARCYCDHCAAAFRAWLAARYGAIEALNEAWGAVFWSQTYADWSQIDPPDDRVDKPNPSHALDYARFCSDATAAYQQEQVDLLRRLSPGRFMTHNFMGLFRELDPFDLAASLDLATWDSYPTGNLERWGPALAPDPEGQYAPDVGHPLITGMAHALTYALKRAPFWVMEQQAGAINWGRINPGVRPGTTRLWCWHALAEGASAVVFFRWRATLFAQEQYHSGLLRHDGSPGGGLADVRRLAAERERLAAIAAHPRANRVGLLIDFADLWALELQPHRAGFDYLAHLFVYYQALARLGIGVDLVPADADLAPYTLLVAASAHLGNAALAGRLESWVRQGGQLLFGVRAGFKTPSNRVTDEPLPGVWRSLVGATIVDWQALPDGVGWPVVGEVPGLVGPAGTWVETLRTETARPLAHFQLPDGPVPALVAHERGAGRVTTLGWVPTVAQAASLLATLLVAAGIPPGPALAPGLVAARRGPYLLLLNFTDGPLAATAAGRDVTVPARDVVVLADDAVLEPPQV